MAKASKKPVKSPYTAEQEAILTLKGIVENVNKSVENLKAWTVVTQDMFLGMARLSGLPASELAKAIHESERNKSYEKEVIAELTKIRTQEEKAQAPAKKAGIAKRNVDAPTTKATKKVAKKSK